VRCLTWRLVDSVLLVPCCVIVDLHKIMIMIVIIAAAAAAAKLTQGLNTKR